MGTENVNTTMKGNVLNLLKDEFLAKKTNKNKKNTRLFTSTHTHISSTCCTAAAPLQIQASENVSLHAFCTSSTTWSHNLSPRKFDCSTLLIVASTVSKLISLPLHPPHSPRIFFCVSNIVCVLQFYSWFLQRRILRCMSYNTHRAQLHVTTVSCSPRTCSTRDTSFCSCAISSP